MLIHLAAESGNTPATMLDLPADELERLLTKAWERLRDRALPKEIQPHMVYALLWEQTGVIDVFRAVLEHHLDGERLGAPASPEAQKWLLTTEALLFTDPQPRDSVLRISSTVRPDAQAVRRRAYYRMFGAFDGAEGSPPAGAYLAFRLDFHDLLHNVYEGIVNRPNIAGPDPTDYVRIEDAATRLCEELGMRRRMDNLLREEFASVALLSWCHLTLLRDTAIVKSLRAEAMSPAQRLVDMGARVDVSPDPRSASLIKLADPMSALLRLIETGKLGQRGAGRWLCNDSDMSDKARLVMYHWAAVTGMDPKTPVADLPSAIVDRPELTRGSR